MRAGRLAAWLFLALIASSAGAAPLDIIRECADSAAPNLRGIDKLSSTCPELQSALVSLGLDQTLYDGWRENLSVYELRDLAALVPQFQARTLVSRPGKGSLSGILSTLNQRSDSAPKGWWDNFKEWWRNWLARSDSVLARWLRQLSEHIEVSPKVVVGIAYAVAALVAALVIALAIREWRTWRLARLEASAPRSNAALEEVAAQFVAPSQANSAEERLSTLLRDLVARLLATGRLHAERSLTHRELVQRSRFDDAAQSGTFAAVSRVAEALLYGPRGSVQAEVPQAIAGAESLLLQLESAAP